MPASDSRMITLCGNGTPGQRHSTRPVKHVNSSRLQSPGTRAQYPLSRSRKTWPAERCCKRLHCRSALAPSVASLPARGPARSVGIDGELRVNASGRPATHLIHERDEEAASRASRRGAPREAWGSTGNCESTLAADPRRISFMSGMRQPRRELPGAGPRVAGIDGELRVDARGRHATHLIHKWVEEAAELS